MATFVRTTQTNELYAKMQQAKEHETEVAATNTATLSAMNMSASAEEPALSPARRPPGALARLVAWLRVGNRPWLLVAVPAAAAVAVWVLRAWARRSGDGLGRVQRVYYAHVETAIPAAAAPVVPLATVTYDPHSRPNLLRS